MPGNPRLFLLLLFAVNALNFFDRLILAAVTEPVKQEWALSDTRIGWLGTAFTLLYAAAGIPLGRLADTWNRTRLLGMGVALWSALTFASGLCRTFTQLFLARLGIGAGEAVCAPAATSLIGDLYPANRRGRALSIFMLGLPAGVALSYIVSGTVAQHFGWRAAFFVAGVPGFFLGAVLLKMREPQRAHSAPGLVFAALKSSAFWLIVVSGALHNFNMYALTFFLPALLSRYHRATLQTAGFASGIVVGLVGGAGMIIAGWAADRVYERCAHRRLLVAAFAILLGAPSVYFALEQPGGALMPFALFLGVACFLLYAYYGVVYAALQDIVAPEFRGTAMAIYFLAMYLLGASLGPVALGRLSDYFRARYALGPALALHRAMYVIPASCLVLGAVLLAAASRIKHTHATR
ncbi:MAG: MFS transporter [Acidobacteria bacterium]|nr:MFS transporter [Acidobacteriota bacterium]